MSKFLVLNNIVKYIKLSSCSDVLYTWTLAVACKCFQQKKALKTHFTLSMLRKFHSLCGSRPEVLLTEPMRMQETACRQCLLPGQKSRFPHLLAYLGSDSTLLPPMAEITVNMSSSPGMQWWTDFTINHRLKWCNGAKSWWVKSWAFSAM